MNIAKLVTIGLAVLVLTAGAVAAAPGNAPGDAQAGDDSDQPGADAGVGNAGADDAADNAGADDAADNASPADDTDAAEDNAPMNKTNGSAADDRRGPPSDMPEPVPDRVGEIHSQIDEFLNGDGTFDLGEAVSDVASSDEEQSEQAGDNDEEDVEDSNEEDDEQKDVEDSNEEDAEDDEA
jgi:hypothetical protein